MKIKSLLTISCVLVYFFSISQSLAGASDPGVRGGAPGGGAPLPGMTANELALFDEGLLRALEIEATCDACEGGIFNSAGLGARFNGDQCTVCHSHPASGGSSPPRNPMFEVANRRGGRDPVPFFNTIDGPVREARFVFNPDGTRDGGVHNLFTVSGRADAPLCDIRPPNFAAQAANNNLVFRIPLQLFGLGLIEGIPDKTILANLSANRAEKDALGIKGKPNRNPNDGTISRFGWKAQNKSILIFSGEAYNVEMGVTNDVFPTPRDETANCLLNNFPNDVIRTAVDKFTDPRQVHPDYLLFKHFMAFLDAPQPIPLTARAQRGQTVFTSTGCALCHTAKMKTGDTFTPVTQFKDANLYSDLLLHKMGARLADNIIQGDAGPDEFRTTPLWGVGQRVFFMHDGRTKDLEEAIELHASSGTKDYAPSEANAVIARFARLSENDKQALLDFLRSL